MTVPGVTVTMCYWGALGCAAGWLIDRFFRLFVCLSPMQLRAKPVQYQIIDKAPAEKHPDWERVVCVIVQGAKWQFKDWPFRVSFQSVFEYCIPCVLVVSGP